MVLARPLKSARAPPPPPHSRPGARLSPGDPTMSAAARGASVALDASPRRARPRRAPAAVRAARGGGAAPARLGSRNAAAAVRGAPPADAAPRIAPSPRSPRRARASPRARAAADDGAFGFDDAALDDDDDAYPGMRFDAADGAPPEPSASRSRWAVEEGDIAMSPEERVAAAADRGRGDRALDDDDDWPPPGGGGGGGGGWVDDEWSPAPADTAGEDAAAARSRSNRAGASGSRGGDDNSDDSFLGASKSSFGSSSARGGGWLGSDDIIAGGNEYFLEGDDDWYEPEYVEIDAPEGSVLEKVQRLHLRQPADYTFEDGEYFDLTGFVKDNTDNQFALVLEVAERARERRVEHLEALNPAPADAALPPIQHAVVDLALEVEASGGATSAFGAMREAADRARLRWELQEAAWAWDNYCEEHMEALGVSERAARLLHMGQRVEDAMDFEKDLAAHEDDYNAKPPRT